MAFPFTISYSESFINILSDEETEEVLLILQDYMEQQSAMTTEIKGSKLVYSGTTTGERNHILNEVDKGVFTITHSENNSILTYKIFQYHLVIIVSVCACLFGFMGQNMWLSLLPITCPGGVIRIVSFLRHRQMFNDIKAGLHKFYPIN